MDSEYNGRLGKENQDSSNFFQYPDSMDNDPNGKKAEIQTEDANSNLNYFSQMPPDPNKQTCNTFNASSSHRGLLEMSGPLGEAEKKAPTPQKPKRKFLKYLKRPSIKGGFLKLGSSTLLVSPSATFQRIAGERDEVSRATQTPAPMRGLKDGFKMPFVGEIRWKVLRVAMKEWLRNPKNLALFIWGIAVAVSGAILFLVLVGFLNKALPNKTQRDAWFEVSNQILNALFAMMCLYHHPLRFYHLSLLCRWNQEDIIKLRKIYCKNGTYKPHEWAHIMIVVLLLHLNCFAQYALCGLNWGYKRSERPAIGVGLCLAVAIGAPAVAGLYLILSPLGKEYDIDLEAGGITDVEVIESGDSFSKAKPISKMLEKRYSFVVRENKRMEPKPEWQGGLFDFSSDLPLAFFSTFALFCVFGWNMDRLGFGNMYVHIVTFILLCMAPFWIFNLAAINIDNEHVREALGITGIILCVFGLLYGGFWRVQMRKKFGLPANRWCFGQPTLTDLMQWLFCSVCSLSQEVRTGDFYEVWEDKLFLKQAVDCDLPDMGGASPQLVPLSHEPGSPALLPSSMNSHYLSTGQLPLNGQASASHIPSSMFSAGSSPMRETHVLNPLAFRPEDASKEEDQMEKSNIKTDPMNAPIPLRLQRE
uniref:Uncharacterized protein n=1 Tax=Araucaria cunninghamii TaxID=56994 RepID=A0A0D6QR86_ARACU